MVDAAELGVKAPVALGAWRSRLGRVRVALGRCVNMVGNRQRMSGLPRAHLWVLSTGLGVTARLPLGNVSATLG